MRKVEGRIVRRRAVEYISLRARAGSAMHAPHLRIQSRRVALATVVALALAACQSTDAPPELNIGGNGLVYGRVLLPDSQPAVGARVRNDLSYLNATITDSAGRYRLALVAPLLMGDRVPIGLTFFGPVGRDGPVDSVQVTVQVNLAESAAAVRDSSRLDVVLGTAPVPH